MNWEVYVICGLVVAFNIFLGWRLIKTRKQVAKFYTSLLRKNSTELDLELATSDQLIKALVTRPGYPLILITPKNEKQLEVHVRNVTPLGICNLLATAQLVILNQDNLQKEGNDYDGPDE